MLGKGVAEYIRSKFVDVPAKLLGGPISLAWDIFRNGPGNNRNQFNRVLLLDILVSYSRLYIYINKRF
jgi:hypothetical protein